MTRECPSSVVFICDFGQGFSGATHHLEGVGGTQALVVVLAETLAARGSRVTVATRIPSQSRERDVLYLPVQAVRPREADVTVLVKQWSAAAVDAARVRFSLGTGSMSRRVQTIGRLGGMLSKNDR
jgi:NAD(P)-dependent dehydrogenase (short-subunit alcohol dehydrogenase family)